MKQTLTEHRFAALLPLMEGEDFDRLVADIREHGQLEPITLMNGMILDGRNRYRACQEIGVKPYTIEYEGDDALSFVVSVNFHRRHLDQGQRAIFAAKLETMRHGQRADLTKAREANLPLLGEPAPAAPTVTRNDAAQMLNVSPRSVQHAASVLKHGTAEIVRAVEAGRVAVSAAAQVARLPIAEQQAVAAGGDKAITEKARELREAKMTPEAAPVSNVVQLAPRQPALPSFGDLDREIDADNARADALAADDIDIESVHGRAHAFNGAISTLDYIVVSGREYWSIFDKDPAKTTYLERVRVAYARLGDILKEAEDVQRQTDAAGKPEGTARRGKKAGPDRL